MKKLFFSITLFAMACSLSAPALGGGLREFLEEHPPLEGGPTGEHCPWFPYYHYTGPAMKVFNRMEEKPEWAKNVRLRLTNHQETQSYNLEEIVMEGWSAILVKATPESSANPTLLLRLKNIDRNPDKYILGSMFGLPFQKYEYRTEQYARFRNPEFFPGIAGWAMEYVVHKEISEQFLETNFVPTFQALSTPAQTIFRKSLIPEDYLYKDAARKARVQGTSGAGERVSVDFPEISSLSPLFGSVQVVSVRKPKKYKEVSVSELELTPITHCTSDEWIEAPDCTFLRPDRWEAILNNVGGKYQANFSPEGLELLYQPYELWSKSWSEENPHFLGYLEMRRAAKSLDEFFLQTRQREPRPAAFNGMDPKPGWTKGIPVKLDNDPNPQRYDLEEIVGEGGDGTVFRAVPQDDRNPVVALKMWSADLGNGSKDIEMSKQGILQYLGLLSHEEQTFTGRLKGLVMEYIDGPTLEEFLRQPPAHLGLENAKKIIEDIHAGLDARDLADFTFLNVMVKREGNGTYTVRFIDFTKWADGSTFPRATNKYNIAVRGIAHMVTDATPAEKQTLIDRHEKHYGSNL